MIQIVIKIKSIEFLIRYTMSKGANNMIMITTHKDGFILENGAKNRMVLTKSDALMFSQAIDRIYHIEDIKNEIEKDDAIDETKITEEVIDEICDEYESRLEDDDSWNFMLRDVISEFKKTSKCNNTVK